MIVSILSHSYGPLDLMAISLRRKCEHSDPKGREDPAFNTSPVWLIEIVVGDYWSN